MHARWGLALPVALVALGGLAEAADSGFQRRIDAAVHLYKKLDYEDALEQLYRAKSYSTGVDDDVLIALYRGIVLADMGKEDESADSFRTGLFLKADAVLPIAVPPKVRENFERIKGEVKKEIARGHPSPVPKTTATAPPPLPAAPPEATATATATSPPPSGGLRQYAWIPMAAGGAVAAGGIYALVRAGQDASALAPGGGQTSTLSGPQAQQTRDDGKVSQTLGVVGVCVGAAAVAAGGAMFAWGGEGSGLAASAWAVPGGGGVALAGSFP